MELELRPLDMKVDFFYPRQNKWNRLWIVFPRTLLENKNYIFLRKYKFDWTQKSYDDSKEVIRSRKSKDRKFRGQKKNHKRTYNDLQNTTLKTTDWGKRIAQKIGVNSGALEG